VHVVFLTHNYPRHPGDLPGAFLHPLAVAVRDLGHEVSVVAPSDGGRGGEDVLDGVPIRRVRYASPSSERYAYTGAMQSAIRSPSGLWALYGLWKALRQGARDVAGGEPETVVHAHWWVPAGLAAPPEFPLVLTLHGTDGTLLERSPAARMLARPVLRRSDVVTAVSTVLAETASHTAGFEAGRVRVQPMPVVTEGWGWSRGGGGCVVVARLTAQKRLGLVLDAIAALRADGLSLRTTIVGDGPERARLEARRDELGLGDLVRFAGALPFAGVLEHLMTADVSVLPALHEGFGLSAVEALMAGVPTVACEDGGGLLDVVPREGAGRIASATGDGIARALRELQGDPQARARARRLGEDWRAKLAPSAVAERFAGWYAEAARA
jgi:glycosyltransferase involved in cell wall biosynthesis